MVYLKSANCQVHSWEEIFPILDALDRRNDYPAMTSHKAKKKPSYDQSLCAYQAAFKVEFTRIVECLPLTKESRILDTPCGNGFYAQMLADRLGPKGEIDCVDLNAEYLASTRKRMRNVK